MIPFPNKKYNIIYADPPWSYKNSASKEYVGVHGRVRFANAFYPTMTIDELKSLPISEISDDNCVLICWVIGSLLPEAIDVIKKWGFNFKTILFCWVKTYTSGKIWCGMGYYTRGGMEICLLATRGSVKRLNRSIKQVQLSNVTKHSEKPHLFRDLIVQLFGNLPRIELFARQKSEGWDSWGNEV